jgi:SAM-dependent methyltransferase
MIKTEFFETAVQQGFYGNETSGLYGKKDYVRKYWEDFSIKSLLKPIVVSLLESKDKIRIADFGCGCGEAFELITHISPLERPTKKDFLIHSDQIELYYGMDISSGMIEKGKLLYEGKSNIRFKQANLAKDYTFLEEEPFDIYLSTYSSPSHLTVDELNKLVEKVLTHSSGKSYLVLDLFGKYSPEWPQYWSKSLKEMLPYNMAWLHLPNKLKDEQVENYYVTFWDAESLKKEINAVAAGLNKKITISTKDRSVFIGRHTDTGYFNNNPQPLRYQVNRLFDRDYEGRVDGLKADFSFLDGLKEQFPDVWERINYYHDKWNTVVGLCGALIDNKNELIKGLIETSESDLSEELKMLTWLYRNQQRFPVDNFWASVMGPQLACVLRNLELNLPEGLGCGHGLFCIVEIN